MRYLLGYQSKVSIAALILSLSVSTAFAECNLEEHGDCCKSDQDCEVFVYESLCTVMPLNKKGAEKLRKESPPPLGSCTPEVVTQLKKDASVQKVKCVESACEFE